MDEGKGEIPTQLGTNILLPPEIERSPIRYQLPPDTYVIFDTKRIPGGYTKDEVIAVRNEPQDSTGLLAWISRKQMELKNKGIKETRKINKGTEFKTFKDVKAKLVPNQVKIKLI